jgi:hypothetical protein
MSVISEAKSGLMSELKPVKLIVTAVVVIGILWAVKFIGSKVPAVKKIDPTA